MFLYLREDYGSRGRLHAVVYYLPGMNFRSDGQGGGAGLRAGQDALEA
jgi:hypothetical protein